MTEMYLPVFYVHVTCALLSVSFFCLRGSWMISGSSLLHQPAVRVLPHVIDTVLLGSAVWLTVILGQYPFVQGWLTAKLLALLLYIVIGSVALKRGKTRQIRMIAFFLSLCIVLYIISVAYFHSAKSFLVLFP